LQRIERAAREPGIRRAQKISSYVNPLAETCPSATSATPHSAITTKGQAISDPALPR
jgi:hypothetical protein